MNTLPQQQKFALFNTLSVLLVLAINYYAQFYGLNGNTIAGLSDTYANLFTPAGYAFAIWGFIYVGLLVFCGAQLYQSFFLKKQDDFTLQMRGWFILTNSANAAWIFAWLYEYTLISVLIMLVMLFALLRIVLATNMERWDAPKRIIGLYWWPICFYSGWIAVATVANISAYLAKIEWDGFGISEEVWTIILIFITTLINLLIIYKRNMREFAAVAVWALVAIFYRHQQTYASIAMAAIFGASVLLGYILYHGYINNKHKLR